MKTNKTPIQEFKEELINLLIENKEKNSPFTKTTISVIIEFYIPELLQKEKQFAFDCFQAGNRFGMDVCGSFDWGQQPTKPDFDEFYSKYVSQHTK